MEKLTEGQNLATATALNALNTSTEKRVVFLEGLSEGAISQVVDGLKSQVGSKNAVIDDFLEGSLSYSCGRERSEKNLKKGHVVTSGSPRQLELLGQSLSRSYPENKLVACVVKGMTMPESIDYVRALRGSRTTTLTDEQLAAYSLGVSEIAQMLIADPNITEDLAARIAGVQFGHDALNTERYHNNPAQAVDYYLSFSPPVSVIANAQEARGWRDNHIYDRLGRVLKHSFDLQTQGIQEDSPLFVVPESVEIYNEMIKKDRDYSRIQIFVPEIPAQDFPALSRAFGLDAARNPSEYAGNPYTLKAVGGFGGIGGYREGTRVRMFDDNERKVDVWFKEPNGQTHLEDANEGMHSDETAREYMQQFRRNGFPLKSRYGSEQIGAFYLQTYENGTSINANRGWMVESLLQRRGLPYFVSYFALRSNYIYNPDNQTLHSTSFDLHK